MFARSAVSLIPFCLPLVCISEDYVLDMPVPDNRRVWKKDPISVVSKFEGSHWGGYQIGPVKTVTLLK